MEELVEGISVECCLLGFCSVTFGKSKLIRPGGPNASDPVDPELSDPLREKSEVLSEEPKQYKHTTLKGHSG